MARAPNKEDRRATDVFLTAEGLRLVNRLRAQVQQALAPVTGRLSASEQRRLRELLQRTLARGAS